MVATDRISAFDVVLPDTIPDKGKILTRLSNFWFAKTKATIANHLTGIPPQTALPEGFKHLQDRSVIVKKVKPLLIEAIVRGYLIGSGWRDYQKTGQISGLQLPPKLQLAQQLPEIIFTPSTKAEIGTHDENISFTEMCRLVGEDRAQQVREISIKLYKLAAEHAIQRGIIIADTKFEFGIDENDELILIDELLTPDSSRFWPADEHQIGCNPPSLDKQYIRDYVSTLDWDKTTPGPHLPAEIIAKTSEKYNDIADRLMR